MTKQKQEKVKVFALGGVGELGKNMHVVEVDGDIIVIDAGLMLPENDMLGVDVVIPDITYLLENRDRVLGIFLTHAHEDHMGALPYVLKQLNVPVYGTKLTLGLLKYKLSDAGLLKKAKLRLIDTGSDLRMGRITLSFFRTNHTIPDSIGICVHTRYGMIVNTGDFKFDHTPVDHKSADIRKMAAVGEKGVLCLLSDSTNAEVPGTTGSELSAGREISNAFYSARGRVIVVVVASNIHRLQQVFDVAAENGRKVAAVGRNMMKVIDIARDLGYLNIRDDVLVPIKGINRLPDEECVLLTSGSQGEPISALAQMVNNGDKALKIKPKDTVVIADNPNIGNEKTVSQTIDELTRIGAEVVYNRSMTFDTGHASQEDLKLMLRMMTPKYFIPIHGEYRMLKIHSNLAEDVGIPEQDIFIAERGECVEFVNGEARWGGKVPSGNVLVDGHGIGDVGNIVLRDRKLLSEDGILLVVVTLGRKSKEILSGPEIISRGFVYVRESEQLLDEANRIVSEVLKQSLGQNISEWSSLKSGIRDSLSRYLFDKTRRRPMILPIIMEV
ncbi:MAG TPA: ribonuclease J [Bacillales bacterium]|nr:ribonuclease J [Bacillales bacterium]